MCTCASYAHALMILEMSSGPTRRVLCINMSKIACQTPFPFVDSAKLRIKKARWKFLSIGREFVGVLVGVLVFLRFSVGVLPRYGGSFGFSVGVLWEFLF